MDDVRFHHHPFLAQVAQGDVEKLLVKDKEYGASWKKRGGVGAYMMLARKWDRLEEQVEQRAGFDIIAAARNDRRPEGILDDIRDLRRYLLLVEAELLALGICGTIAVLDWSEPVPGPNGSPTVVSAAANGNGGHSREHPADWKEARGAAKLEQTIDRSKSRKSLIRELALACDATELQADWLATHYPPWEGPEATIQYRVNLMKELSRKNIEVSIANVFATTLP